MWWNLNILRDTLRRGGQPTLVLLSPAGVSRAYASSLLMCSGKAQDSYSALPALDAPVGFIQDFEDVISFDFSESLKSCIAPRIWKSRFQKQIRWRLTIINRDHRIACHYTHPPRNYDLTIKSNPGFVPFITGWSVASRQGFQKQGLQSTIINSFSDWIMFCS